MIQQQLPADSAADYQAAFTRIDDLTEDLGLDQCFILRIHRSIRYVQNTHTNKSQASDGIPDNEMIYCDIRRFVNQPPGLFGEVMADLAEHLSCDGAHQAMVKPPSIRDQRKTCKRDVSDWCARCCHARGFSIDNWRTDGLPQPNCFTVPRRSLARVPSGSGCDPRHKPSHRRGLPPCQGQKPLGRSVLPGISHDHCLGQGNSIPAPDLDA